MIVSIISTGSDKMARGTIKKEITDADVKRKAVKLVVSHLVKKLPEENFLGSDNIVNWIARFEELLEKPEFIIGEYYEMRRELNDIIERTMEEDLRYKFRDSWFSLGKALDKKAKII